MKLLSTTALTAALMTAAVPSLTSPAHAWGWRGGGWGWGGAGVGLAAGALIGGAIAASSYGYGYGYPAYGYGYGTGYGYPAYGTAMGPVTPRPIAMVMAPARKVTRLTAMVMAPARATRLTGVTGTPITPLSDAISMPPPTVFDVIGIGTNKPPGDTRPFSCGQVAMSALGQKPPRQLPTGASGLGQKPTSHRRFDDFDSRRQSISARAPELLSEGHCGSYVDPSSAGERLRLRWQGDTL